MSVELQPAPHRLPAPRSADHDLLSYRAVSSLAVVSAVLGGMSLMAFLDWVLVLVPVVGLVTGLLALRQIALRSDELTGERWAKLGIALSALFWAGGWSYMGLVYATEVPDGYQRISYAQLHLTDDDVARRALPESAKVLDGQRVFLKGYIFPGAHSTGIRQFVLVRDNGDCCFGGPAPPVGDMVLVTLPEGAMIDYTTRLRRVAGTFRIAPALSGDVNAGVVYQLDADSIR